jgi:hypothetical protein
MWRGTSSWHLTLQLKNRVGAGKSPVLQDREEYLSSQWASEWWALESKQTRAAGGLETWEQPRAVGMASSSDILR